MKTMRLSAILIAAAVAVGCVRISDVRASCDEYGAVKLGNDVYECKRERGLQ